MKKSLFLIAFAFYSLAYAQETKPGVGIGTANPDPSAALHVSATNKGVLFPSVTLTASDDKTTIPNPAVGLLVYSTGTLSGYYYWDGAAWSRFDESTSVSPLISELQCTNASLNPPAFTKVGTVMQEYTGTLTIPYTGGNGGRYAGSTTPLIPNDQNGMTYSLIGDKLAMGSGVIAYNVKGTPTLEALDKGVTFPIKFLGKECDATVGTGTIIDFIKYARTSFIINAETPTKSLTKIGNLEVRYNGTNPNAAGYIQFRTLQAAYVSWIYRKAGVAAQNMEYYDGVASAPDTWNFLARGINEANINAPNRDIGEVTLTIQGADLPVGHPNNPTNAPLRREGQLYRITLQATSALGSTTKGAYQIPGTVGSGTIFVEELGSSVAN